MANDGKRSSRGQQQQEQEQHRSIRGGGCDDDGLNHPESHHHTAPETERLEMYSDAVIAIIATVMAIPLASLTEEEKDGSVYDALMHKGTKIAWFVASFNMVAYWWGYHSALMQQIKHVSFWTMLLNLIFLLSLSFYPVTYVFAQDYISNWRATSLFMAILTSTSISFALLRWLSRPHSWEVCAETMAWKLCMVEDATHVVVLGVALGAVQLMRAVSEDYAVVSWAVLLAKVILDILVYRWYARRYPRVFADPRNPNKTLRRRHFFRRVGYADVERNRLEAFSDGVFAIAATFQFLEIEVPSQDEEPLPSFKEALQAASEDVGAYLISFSVLGLLWINHHGIIEQLIHIPRALRILNTQQLVCIAILPFFFSLLVNFWYDRTALIWVSCAVGTTGLMQLAVWGLAHLLHNTRVSRSIAIDNAVRSNSNSTEDDGDTLVEEPLVLRVGPYDRVRNPYIVCRLLVVPAIGFITAGVAAGTDRVHLFLFLLAPVAYWICSYFETRAVERAVAAQHSATEAQPLVQHPR